MTQSITAPALKGAYQGEAHRDFVQGVADGINSTVAEINRILFERGIPRKFEVVDLNKNFMSDTRYYAAYLVREASFIAPGVPPVKKFLSSAFNFVKSLLAGPELGHIHIEITPQNGEIQVGKPFLNTLELINESYIDSAGKKITTHLARDILEMTLAELPPEEASRVEQEIRKLSPLAPK